MWRRVKGEMGLFNDQCVTQSFMSLNKGVARLKFKRRQLPFPPSSSLSSPPLSPLPARGSGGALWAPPLGLGWNPSRWSIWCIFESKRMALVTTLLWTLNQNIFSFLDWVSESWNPRLWRLIAILVNFLVCRKKTRGGNCLLMLHTSYIYTPLSLKVKEFWKSVNICQSYGRESSVLFFTHRVVTNG